MLDKVKSMKTATDFACLAITDGGIARHSSGLQTVQAQRSMSEPPSHGAIGPAWWSWTGPRKTTRPPHHGTAGPNAALRAQSKPTNHAYTSCSQELILSQQRIAIPWRK